MLYTIANEPIASCETIGQYLSVRRKHFQIPSFRTSHHSRFNRLASQQRCSRVLDQSLYAYALAQTIGHVHVSAYCNLNRFFPDPGQFTWLSLHDSYAWILPDPLPSLAVGGVWRARLVTKWPMAFSTTCSPSEVPSLPKCISYALQTLCLKNITLTE